MNRSIVTASRIFKPSTALAHIEPNSTSKSQFKVDRNGIYGCSKKSEKNKKDENVEKKEEDPTIIDPESEEQRWKREVSSEDREGKAQT